VVPLLGLHLAHGAVHGDARVVDEDVEPAVALDHLGHDPLAIGVVLDRALMDGGAVVPEALKEGLGRGAVAGVAGSHTDALADQMLADRQADPTHTPRDERNVVRQARAHATSSTYSLAVQGRRQAGVA
jgi:hypothetical protein